MVQSVREENVIKGRNGVFCRLNRLVSLGGKTVA